MHHLQDGLKLRLPLTLKTGYNHVLYHSRAIKTHQSVGLSKGEVMLFWFLGCLFGWLVVRFPQFEH